MPTKELTQALEEAAVEGSEKGLVEVIARLFKTDPGLVMRVIYAYRTADDAGPAERIELDVDLEHAIDHAVEDGLRRVRVRRAVLSEQTLTVPVAVLTLQPKDICRGCPVSLRCVIDGISTPAKCYGTTKAEVQVRPTKLQGNRVTVRAEQPLGTFEVTVRDFCLPRPYRPKKDR